MKRTLLQRFWLVVLLLTVALLSSAKTTYNKGNVTINVGEERTFYHNLDPSITVSSNGWFIRQTTGNSWVDGQEDWCLKIVSKNSQSCTIKGLADNSSSTARYELHCLSEYETYECYWTITVKKTGGGDDPKPLPSLSANPSGGQVEKGTIVKLYANGAEAQMYYDDVYYTLDGNAPNADNGKKYTYQGIPIEENCILRAVGKKWNGNGYDSSDELTETYTIKVNDGDLFTAKIAGDIDMTFKVISAADMTCQVGDGNWKNPAIDTSVAGEITIPSVVNGYTVVQIGGGAFRGCEEVTSFNLPNNIVEIGYSAFSECSSLESINIPTGLKAIGSCAFSNCEKLSSPIIIPEGVKAIENRTFFVCKKLSSVTLPSTLTIIEERAFQSCDVLESINFPDGLTTIGESAFFDCPIKSIHIPVRVSSIAKSAFSYCGRHIESITVASGNTVYDSRGDCNAIIETGSNTLLIGCKNTIIPDGITSIGDEAFLLCSGLTSVIFPEGLNTIGNNAFRGARLTSLFLPEGVVSIGKEAFYSNELNTISLPKSVVSIGEKAFASNRYNSHNGKIYSYAIQPIDINENVFDEGGYRWGTLYIPEDSKSKYESAEGWKNFKNIIEMIEPDAVNIPATATVKEGETIELKAEVTPSNAITSLKWTSDDETIATVNSEGVVTGIKKGQTFINVETDNGKTAYCKLTVTALDPISITISPTSKTIEQGETFTATYTLTPSNAQTTVTWSSDNESIATVTQEGVVTGVGVGSTVINVKTANGKSASCTLTVTAPKPIGITISPTSKTIEQGETFTATYTLTPSNAQTTVTWSSDNESIATVTQEGVVTGVGVGSTFINVETANGKTASCKLTVTAPDPIGITIIPTSKTIEQGETFTATYTLTPSNATTTVTWSSDNESIATVTQEGVVTGVGVGSTFINVETANGMSAYCKLTVTSPQPIAVSIPKNATVNVGETITLTATLTPANAVTTLTWQSDDPAIATVDANGTVTGIAEGLAIIKVSTANGLTSTCKLTVNPPSGIEDVNADYTNTSRVFTLSGQRLAVPKKGINIIGGKKVVLK